MIGPTTGRPRPRGDLEDILRRGDQLPDMDSRSPDEIIDYDNDGVLR